jgi:hypothetical protein
MIIRFARLRDDEIHLTLSVLIGGDGTNSIKRFQGSLSRLLQAEGVKTSNRLRRKGGNGKRSYAYVYPSRTLHFSMLDFYECRGVQRFGSARRKVLTSPLFQHIKRFAGRINRRLRSASFRFEIKSIRKRDRCHQVNLCIFPLSRSLIQTLKQARNEWRQKARQLESVVGRCELLAELKAYPNRRPRYFAINILQFIGEGTADVPGIDSCIDCANEILRSHPLEVSRLKPRLVVSNAYLSNPDPIIR